MLSDPALTSAPYRRLAGLAGVSNGTVQYTMRNLQHTGHVVALGGGGRGERRIERTGDLLDRWATGYADVLRPKLSLGWFRSLGAPDAVLGWRDVRLEPGEVWGGEPVAALLTDLRPARLTLYTRAPKPDVMQRLRVVPCAFEAGVLEILRPPWADEAERTLDTPFWTRASRVLALGDLRASDDPHNAKAAARIGDLIAHGDAS